MVSIVIILISGWLLLEVKYYYFGALLPVLFAYFFFKRVASGVNISSVKQVCLILFILSIGFAVSTQFHGYLNPKHWGEIIAQSKQEDINVIDLIVKSPEALVRVWLEPQFWNAQNTLQLLAGIENFLFFLLLVLAAYYNRNPLKWKVEWWLILVYSLSLSVMMGLSISNLGSLSRYKTSFYPFLFLAVSCGIPQFKSLITFIFASRIKKDGKTSNNFWSEGNRESIYGDPA